MPRMPRALAIAGSDPGGGAGLQADLKTFAAYGVYGLTAVTAVTVQNTLGVEHCFPMPADLVTAQIRAVVEDIGTNAVKTGMLVSAGIIAAVAEAADRYDLRPMVVDPVLQAQFGEPLLDLEAVEILVERLIPRAAVLTPNIAEAERLAGMKIQSRADMERAAARLKALGCAAVVLKGGHRIEDPDTAADLLLDGDGPMWLQAPRIATEHTHGTGCTFASALTAGLARGWDLRTAARRAKQFVTEALRHAPGLGRGSGPLQHFWMGSLPFPSPADEPPAES